MKKLLRENLWLKVSAVLLSVFLWLFVTSSGQSEQTFEVPVEFKNVPIGMGIVNSSIKSVNVTVRGQERLMKNLRGSDIRVLVSLTKAMKGEGTYFIEKDDVKLPYAMSVINVQPPSIKLSLEEMVTKTVRVKPVIIGVPEKGFFVGQITVDPRTVQVKGLQSDIKRLRDVRTEAIDITGFNKTITQEVNLDAGINGLTPDSLFVKVTVTITGAAQ